MHVNKLKKDFLWYSIGTFIPMLLNMIKTPIFTRYFNPSDYGSMTMVNTTYSYINLFVFSWILSCVWRYYINQKKNNELEKFYTNIIILFIAGFLITSIITFIWILLSSDIIIKKLIFSNYLSLITIIITTIYLTIIRLNGKALLYNIYTVVASIFSFIALFLLTFVFNNTIDAMINCNNIINAIFSAYIVYLYTKNYKFSKKNISLKFIRELLNYGFATILFNMGLLLMTSGDRYIIKIFNSVNEVGIYTQIYGIAQISIVVFINIFLNITNPYTFKLYEDDINNDFEFYKYIMLYVICVLPFTVYFSMYSFEISQILLGEKFRDGYNMLPYIMISCFIYGLSGMHETRMKFKKKLKEIAMNIITASLINIILNFIFIPKMGYEIASITTLISFIYLYFMDILHDDFSINKIIVIIKKRAGLITTIFVILFFQVILHYTIRNYFQYYSIAFSILEGTIFLSSFYFLIYYRYKELFSGNNI